jgi:hypothetical protein
MENKDIILFILTICVIYLIYCNGNKESFTSTSIASATSSASIASATTSASTELDERILQLVEERIRQISTESITDSIKNLGLIAKEIQKDGDLKLPANLNVTGDLDVTGDITSNLNITGNITKSGYNIITPIGTVIWFTGKNVPDKTYMYCNGAELNKNEYIELFNIIGFTYSDFDIGDIFNIPDLRHRFIRSFDDTRIEDEQILVGTTQESTKIWRYTDIWSGAGGVGDFHDESYKQNSKGASTVSIDTDGKGYFVHNHPDDSRRDYGDNIKGLHSVRPKNMTLLPCIKVKYA